MDDNSKKALAGGIIGVVAVIVLLVVIVFGVGQSPIDENANENADGDPNDNMENVASPTESDEVEGDCTETSDVIYRGGCDEQFSLGFGVDDAICVEILGCFTGEANLFDNLDSCIAECENTSPPQQTQAPPPGPPPVVGPPPTPGPAPDNEYDPFPPGYSPIPGTLSFSEAQTHCNTSLEEDENGVLTTIHSLAENAHIQGIAANNNNNQEEQNEETLETRFWIGLHWNENSQEWIDGSNVDFTNWNDDEPLDENCVFMDSLTGKWGTADCDEQLFAVCVAQVSDVTGTFFSTCEDLGWSASNDSLSESCRTSVPCIENFEFSSAVSFCDSIDARLCTVPELNDVNNPNSIDEVPELPHNDLDCTVDPDYVEMNEIWSVNMCNDESYWVVNMDTGERVCRDVSARAGISCCAYYETTDSDVTSELILTSNDKKLLQALDEVEIIREISILAQEPNQRRFQIINIETPTNDITIISLNIRASQFRYETRARVLLFRMRRRFGLGAAISENLQILQNLDEINCLDACGGDACLSSQECSTVYKTCDTYPNCLVVSSNIALDECSLSNDTPEICFSDENFSIGEGDDFIAFEALWDCVKNCHGEGGAEEYNEITGEPSIQPSEEPNQVPTDEPNPEPSGEPNPEPSGEPNPEPSIVPTPVVVPGPQPAGPTPAPGDEENYEQRVEEREEHEQEEHEQEEHEQEEHREEHEEEEQNSGGGGGGGGEEVVEEKEGEELELEEHEFSAKVDPVGIDRFDTPVPVWAIIGIIVLVTIFLVVIICFWGSGKAKGPKRNVRGGGDIELV